MDGRQIVSHAKLAAAWAHQLMMMSSSGASGVESRSESSASWIPRNWRRLASSSAFATAAAELEAEEAAAALPLLA